MMKKWVTLAGLVLVLSPAAARADWLFTPQVGGGFGGGSGFTYGATISWLNAGYVGWETELAFMPAVLDVDNDIDLDLNADTDFIDDNAFSLMFNALIGAPFGGAAATSRGFRPFLSAGLGWLQTSVESDEFLFDESSDKFGFNLGGGAMTDFGRVGLRGDIRYYQALSDENFNDDLGIELGDYDFWRGTVGVTSVGKRTVRNRQVRRRGSTVDPVGREPSLVAIPFLKLAGGACRTPLGGAPALRSTPSSSLATGSSSLTHLLDELNRLANAMIDDVAMEECSFVYRVPTRDRLPVNLEPPLHGRLGLSAFVRTARICSSLRPLRANFTASDCVGPRRPRPI